jgi:hypothetical protein
LTSPQGKKHLSGKIFPLSKEFPFCPENPFALSAAIREDWSKPATKPVLDMEMLMR